MSELYHHGILGMKWGVRRYQNPDGSLTDAGRIRYLRKTDQGYKFQGHYNNDTERKMTEEIRNSYYNKILSDVNNKTSIFENKDYGDTKTDLGIKVRKLQAMYDLERNLEVSKELLDHHKKYQQAVKKYQQAALSKNDKRLSEANKQVSEIAANYNKAVDAYYKRNGYKDSKDFYKKRDEALIGTGKLFYETVKSNDVLKNYNSVDINDALYKNRDKYYIEDYIYALDSATGNLFKKQNPLR